MLDTILPREGAAALLTEEYGRPYTIEASRPVKRPGRGEALIKVEAASICNGDIPPRDGGPPAPPQPVRPLVGGHEGIGRIIAFGEDGEKGHDLKVGDLVGMGWRRTVCGTCKPCRRGLDNICSDSTTSGYDADGTFQEYVSAPSAHLIYAGDAKGTPAQLSPLLCAGGTALGAVRTAAVVAGHWVAITGAAGGVGHLAVKYAKHMGNRVIAIDSQAKEDFCRRIGADEFVHFEDGKTLVGRVMKIAPGGVDGTIVCTGNPSSYLSAIGYSAPLSIIVAVGPTVLQFELGYLMLKGIKLLAQTNGSRSEIEDSLALSAVDIVAEVEELPLSEINSLINRVKSGEVCGRQVVIPSKT